MSEHSNSTSGEAPRPPRRKRYSGKNPRRFEDKYKERDPQKFPETAAKVLASGKTPAGSHVPVLMAESMAALNLTAGLCGIDATLGYGGHSTAILERILPGGRLVSLDVDPIELPKTEQRLRDRGFGEDVFQAVRSNYAGIAKVAGQHFPGGCDFVFADLGCSSMQLDDPTRGFTFKTDGPLDMRMNPQRGLGAADWLQRVSAAELAEVLRDHADEPRAEKLAAELAGQCFAGTAALEHAVRQVLRGLPEETLDLSVRRVFQAVRIAVNDEFGALDTFLKLLPGCLKPGARAAILTFHSGEDRRVKKAFQHGLRDGVYAEVCDGVITAAPDERRNNPRSIPAKLRWATKS